LRRTLSGRLHRSSSFSGFVTDGVIRRKRQYAENKTNHCRNRQTAAFGRARRDVERTVIDGFERSFVEVAVFVRVRIEEETLGAAFHCGTKLSGIRG
jgi:hypothetical protein